MPDAGIELDAANAEGEAADIACKQSRYVVLDNDFRDGKRFLRFLKLWLLKKKSGSKLHYIGCSQNFIFPFDVDEREPAVESWIDELRSQWPLAVPGLHRLELCDGLVVLTLCFGQAKLCLLRLRARADWIFADALLEQQTDQEAWMSRAFARIAASGAGLNLWLSSNDGPPLAADAFIKKFESCGFRGLFVKHGEEDKVEWRGRFAAAKQTDFKPGKSSAKRSRSSCGGRAVIIGGGLAGTSVAAALARRAWDVLVIEQCPGAAQRASGNLAAVISPMLSKDDSLASRLSRASFLHLLREIHDLNRSLPLVRWEQCGVIQLSADDAQEVTFLDLLKSHQYPADYVRHITAREVAKISGSPSTVRGALFFPRAGWVNPPSLCEARLSVNGVRVRFCEQVRELVQKEDHWQVLGEGSRLIAEASVVVLANGFESTNLKQSQYLHLKKVRGQVTHLREAEARDGCPVICGDGYLTPSFDGVCSLGATYDFGVEEGAVIEECHRQNLDRFSKLMPGARLPGFPAVVGGRVGFRSLTADRMPMVGRLADVHFTDPRSIHWQQLADIPRLPGLFTCLGMGSRGVVWSGMAGEILASLIEGEPAPVEGDVLDAIDPARTILREARRLPSL